jgi:hypothetical protein
MTVYQADPQHQPEGQKPAPSLFQQVSQFVAEAAAAADALDVHLTALPQDAAWPARLVADALDPLVRCAALLAFHSRLASGRLTAPPGGYDGPATYAMANTALRSMLPDAAMLVQAVGHVEHGEAAGRLAVADLDRRWLAITLDFVAQVLEDEKARVARLLTQAPPPEPPRRPGPPVPSLN